MSSQQAVDFSNKINIVIIGAVSAGKSTLLNNIFGEQLSECKIKRTTMTPQIYIQSDRYNRNISSEIYDNNKKINEDLIKKSELNQVTLEDIKETHHLVENIYNFTKLENNISVNVYDIPGLNDGRTKDLYYSYINSNFVNFDIIIFVVDINSALNTSDEVEILDTILNNCKLNKNNHSVSSKLIVLANKCDGMYKEKGEIVLEEEHNEMLEQIQKLVKQKVDEIIPNLNYSIIPISAEDSYIYRFFEKHKGKRDIHIDIKYLNKFGCLEIGKTKFNRLSERKKI